jgi:hypothetical protein
MMGAGGGDSTIIREIRQALQTGMQLESPWLVPRPTTLFLLSLSLSTFSSFAPVSSFSTLIHGFILDDHNVLEAMDPTAGWRTLFA